jgi:large subunit ribosomal protein L22
MAPEITAAPAIEAHAMAKHVRVSPQKARLVLDMIRGQRAETALGILRFTPKRVAKHIEKILRSAIANAERKADDAGESLDVDHLFVARCFANEGSRWKRLRPAPMGRAFRYQKRTAHIVVGVAEHSMGVEQRAAAAAAEAESSKGVKGAVKKARAALTGQQQRGTKKRPAKSQSKPDLKKK